MQTYIIPTTKVSYITLSTLMLTDSIQGNTGLKTSSSAASTDGQRVKDRDVWSEGYW